MDELSHFTGATELTVNIRGNDIDFKVLWLQMSLVLSFSFSLLRKKKSLPDLIYIFPSSASLFQEKGGWRQSRIVHPVGGGHPTPGPLGESRMWLPCSFCPKCLLQDKRDTSRASLPSPSQPGPSWEPCATPQGFEKEAQEAERGPAPNSLQRRGTGHPLSPPDGCLQSGPIIPTPMARLLPSSPPAPASPSLRSHLLQEATITQAPSSSLPPANSLGRPLLLQHWPTASQVSSPRSHLLSHLKTSERPVSQLPYFQILESLAFSLGFSVNPS